MKTISTQEQIAFEHYESLQPLGMKRFAPRTGFYKIIKTYKGNIDGLPVPMVSAKWKFDIGDVYLINVEIQLMSFANNPYPRSNDFLNAPLIGKEIQVTNCYREYGINGRFVVEWLGLDQPIHDTELNREMQELRLMEDIQNHGLVDEVSEAIHMQISQDTDVYNAALEWDDVQWNDAVVINGLIFAFQEQNIEESDVK